MQIKVYLHRYSVSSSRFFFIRPTQGIFVPSKIAVLKIAAFHCSFGVKNSTLINYATKHIVCKNLNMNSGCFKDTY